MELNEREKENLRQADRINAILSQSSIAEGAEAAQLRARAQAQALRDHRNRQAETAEAADLMRFKARENELDRQSKQKYYDLLAGQMGGGNADPYAGLTAPEQRKAREQEMTYVNAEDAVTQLEGLGEDQTSSGYAGFFVNVLKDATFTNLAKALSEAAYDADEKAARGAVDASVESFKRALAGANLTVAEIGLSSNWDPSQAQTDEEKIRRLRAMQDAINRNRSVLGLPQMEGGAGGSTGLSDRAKGYLGGN